MTLVIVKVISAVGSPI